MLGDSIAAVREGKSGQMHMAGGKGARGPSFLFSQGVAALRQELRSAVLQIKFDSSAYTPREGEPWQANERRPDFLRQLFSLVAVQQEYAKGGDAEARPAAIPRLVLCGVPS